jgi:hypothetical protein
MFTSGMQQSWHAKQLISRIIGPCIIDQWPQQAVPTQAEGVKPVLGGLGVAPS